jgi:hypothetical protein
MARGRRYATSSGDMKRGEIWWADLGDPRGSAPALRRFFDELAGSLSARARGRVGRGLALALGLS